MCNDTPKELVTGLFTLSFEDLQAGVECWPSFAAREGERPTGD
jgi:hypothetical protein